jgi:hypothetical protein
MFLDMDLNMLNQGENIIINEMWFIQPVSLWHTPGVR